MSDRFEMAEGLLAWARKRYEELGGYIHESVEKQSVSIELRIGVKEILDHLRSAPDYCAREIHERCVGSTAARVYFPIAPPGHKQKDFLSFVGKMIPELHKNKLDLVQTLESFQGFASPDNAWILDFATVCNEGKHEQLSLYRQKPVAVERLPEVNGLPVLKISRSDDTPFDDNFLVAYRPGPPSSGSCPGLFIRFDAVNRELHSFLSAAIDGIQRIVRELRHYPHFN